MENLLNLKGTSTARESLSPRILTIYGILASKGIDHQAYTSTPKRNELRKKGSPSKSSWRVEIGGGHIGYTSCSCEVEVIRFER